MLMKSCHLVILVWKEDVWGALQEEEVEVESEETLGKESVNLRLEEDIDSSTVLWWCPSWPEPLLIPIQS